VFAQTVPRSSALQHAAQLSPVERSYVAKYPGDSGTAVRALCQELLTRLAGTHANAPAASPPSAAPPVASVKSEAP
jgi:chromosome partitioning protein